MVSYEICIILTHTHILLMICNYDSCKILIGGNVHVQVTIQRFERIHIMVILACNEISLYYSLQ